MSEFVFWEGMELSREEGEIPINRRHGHGNGHGVIIEHEHEHEDMMTAGTGSMDGDNNGYKKLLVRYRECLKNHAAGMGGNATDGCGEFMASGEEGTIEALICSACHCHRNFHRKELEGNPQLQLQHQPHPHSTYHYFHPTNTTTRLNIKPSRTIPPLPLPLPLPHQHQMIMPYNIGIGHSESDEQGDPYPRPTSSQLVMKKRFRTKFSQEQKDKMFNFAQKVGWKIQKQEDSVVQHFCQEIGVKRRVLKVWMHNNKHNLAKNNPTTTTTTPTTTTTTISPP